MISEEDPTRKTLSVAIRKMSKADRTPETVTRMVSSLQHDWMFLYVTKEITDTEAAMSRQLTIQIVRAYSGDRQAVKLQRKVKQTSVDPTNEEIKAAMGSKTMADMQAVFEKKELSAADVNASRNYLIFKLLYNTCQRPVHSAVRVVRPTRRSAAANPTYVRQWAFTPPPKFLRLVAEETAALSLPAPEQVRMCGLPLHGHRQRLFEGIQRVDRLAQQLEGSSRSTTGGRVHLRRRRRSTGSRSGSGRRIRRKVRQVQLQQPLRVWMRSRTTVTKSGWSNTAPLRRS